MPASLSLSPQLQLAECVLEAMLPSDVCTIIMYYAISRRMAVIHPRIRNVELVAFVDHGRTTFYEALSKYNLPPDENECITRNCFLFENPSLCLEVRKKAMGIELKDDEEEEMRSTFLGSVHETNDIVVNIVGGRGISKCWKRSISGGEKIACNRVENTSNGSIHSADGAIVLVDVVEGQLAIQQHFPLTPTIPIYFFNKFDRLFLELRANTEEMYQMFVRLLDALNVSPFDVGFGSAKGGWGFMLSDFARLYALRRTNDEAPVADRWLAKLWGDHFWEPSTKHWHTVWAVGRQRGFCKMILEPMYGLWNCVMNSETNPALVQKLLDACSLSWPEEDGKRLHRRQLGDAICARNFPISNVFLRMVDKLPCSSS